ncbi:MAG TPA: glutamate 5-kinase [Phycisphaerales bacterium]|nr:glutamate 5-kinase [Phycisphaerales bacterium]
MRNFTQSSRVVIKIGTSTLSTPDGINTAYFTALAEQVAALKAAGRQVIIVTSGAIGMGAKRLRLNGPVVDLKLRQACAAIGQPLLMHEYHKAFAEHDIIVSQVLLTAEVLSRRKTYLNLRNAVEALLRLGVVPVVNENDSISTAEIGTAFGDNDKLSALVASKIDADLLLMLTDIDALYDKDPRRCPDAQPIRLVRDITADIEKAAGRKKGSLYSTGGMKSKIAAARIAALAGCRIVLADGRESNVIRRILDGEPLGTLFMPKGKLANRARWILNCEPEGVVRIDAGAMAALRRRKSLLPSGVIGIEGHFEAGAVVMINDAAKALTSLSADELRELAGKHSAEIRDRLGKDRRDVVAVPEDIVFLDP